MTKGKKDDAATLQKVEQTLAEITADLQRTRADFENYRKRVEQEKEQLKASAASTTILRLLPVIDNIDRALNHLPEHLKDDTWAQSVVSLSKNLDKALEGLGLRRIEARPGTVFDPGLHDAIQMDDGDGDHEVIAEELQAGYLLNGTPIRHSLVKVTKVKEPNKHKKEN